MSKYYRKLNNYRKALSAEHYLLQRVKKLDSGCWFFTGSKDKDGYGQCHSTKYGKLLNVTRAHQMAYLIWVGKIVNNKVVCHTCDNPSCVNPKHLFLGSILENNIDKINKGRANSAKGQKNGSSKLTKQEVLEIKKLKGIKTSTELSKIYNVGFGQICRIWRGVDWGHL